MWALTCNGFLVAISLTNYRQKENRILLLPYSAKIKQTTNSVLTWFKYFKKNYKIYASEAENIAGSSKEF